MNPQWIVLCAVKIPDWEHLTVLNTLPSIKIPIWSSQPPSISGWSFTTPLWAARSTCPAPPPRGATRTVSRSPGGTPPAPCHRRTRSSTPGSWRGRNTRMKSTPGSWRDYSRITRIRMRCTPESWRKGLRSFWKVDKHLGDSAPTLRPSCVTCQGKVWTWTIRCPSSASTGEPEN